MTPLLDIQQLSVAYRSGDQWAEAVRGVSLALHAGETLGLVGESGCGKSSIAYAIMQYMGTNGRISGGSIRYRGQALEHMAPDALRRIRGGQISIVYQNPQAALHPTLTVGRQIMEHLRHHNRLSRREAHQRTWVMLERVQLPDPTAIMTRYPHQLSGGQQQRILIAMALINNPDVVILDEPTTGLDATTEAAVIDLLTDLRRAYRLAMLFISHDLSLVAHLCDRIAVMYAGQIVETGSTTAIFDAPAHPYTRDLLACIPSGHAHYRHSRLPDIPGRVPPPSARMIGCAYAPRCDMARDRCHHDAPDLRYLTASQTARTTRCHYSDDVKWSPVQGDVAEFADMRTPFTDDDAILQVENLGVQYAQGRRWLPTKRVAVQAVQDVSLDLQPGEVLALVGESGSGKTTLGRCIVGLMRPDTGRIRWHGDDITGLTEQRSRLTLSGLQMVHQMPDATLNPKHTVGHALERTLERFGVVDAAERRKQVIELLSAVRLPAEYRHRYPAQLSGGEKQRVAIARAFAASPDVIVCDEAVSALDVSVQAAVLNLMVDLKQRTGCAYLFIAHDLAIVRYLADRVAIMQAGQLVEIGPADQVFEAPDHPYTRHLLACARTAP